MLNNKSGVIGQIILFILVVGILIGMFIIVDIDSPSSLSSEENSNISDTTKTYRLGDTVQCNDYSVTLKSYEIKNKGARIDSYQVIDDPQWIALTLTYKNTSDSDLDINKNVYIINSNGEKIYHQTMYYDVFKGNHIGSISLIPGGKKTGYLPFTNTKKDKAKNIKVVIGCNSRYKENSTFTFELKNKK